MSDCQPRKQYSDSPPCEKPLSWKEYLLWLGCVVLLAVFSLWWK